MTTGGNLINIAAHPMLTSVMMDSLKYVIDPTVTEANITLYQNFIAKNRSLSSIGQGSDYVVFAHHLSIVSADIGFKGPEQWVYKLKNNLFFFFLYVLFFFAYVFRIMVYILCFSFLFLN